MNISALQLQRNYVSPTYAATKDREAGSSEQPKNASQDANLDETELRDIQQLKARDREVRAHEAAHIAAGGSIVRSGAKLTYARGPDGVLYAIGGEVSIDTSKANTPETTLAKAEKIRRAALAPAKPSSQDRAVAARAARMAMQARQEILVQQQSEEQTRAWSSRAIDSYTSTGSTLETPSNGNIDELI